MKKINIIESVTGVEVNFPPNAYIEKVVIGRYTIQAILPFPSPHGERDF